MSIRLTCGPSVTVITGETEEELGPTCTNTAVRTGTPNRPATASSPRSGQYFERPIDAAAGTP